jgi:hypothetical protein
VAHGYANLKAEPPIQGEGWSRAAALARGCLRCLPTSPSAKLSMLDIKKLLDSAHKHFFMAHRLFLQNLTTLFDVQHAEIGGWR